jgi:hypothetical protein
MTKQNTLIFMKRGGRSIETMRNQSGEVSLSAGWVRHTVAVNDETKKNLEMVLLTYIGDFFIQWQDQGTSLQENKFYGGSTDT